MATDVIMPQMGESITEATITRWLVQVGEAVERDQPLFEISTDKVDAEIPSPVDGVLLEVKFGEGATVPVDEVVAILGEPGEQVAALPADEVPSGEVPSGERSEEETVEVPPVGAPAEPDAAEAPAAATGAPEMPAAAADEIERIRRFSSPVVRKMAAEQGIDLSSVTGSGIHGRVTKRDLEAYLAAGAGARADEERAAATRPAASAAAPPPPAPSTGEPGTFTVPAYRQGENVTIEPMSKIRQITAAHMRYSKDTSAHVASVFHMDLARVARVRERAREGFAREHGTKLTYMPFIFKAVASALKANPKLNAGVDGTNIVYKKDINLGMAVALDWGLIVPVIAHADRLNLVGLAKAANDLADRARSKKLSPDEVQGGTFTVTNPGVFGSLFGTPIINQPQVAILGIGAIEKRPVVVSDADGNDTIAIKPMSYFAITFDHRLVDGADADRFMNHVKRVLLEESWSELDPFL